MPFHDFFRSIQEKSKNHQPSPKSCSAWYWSQTDLDWTFTGRGLSPWQTFTLRRLQNTRCRPIRVPRLPRTARIAVQQAQLNEAEAALGLGLRAAEAGGQPWGHSPLQVC